MKENEIYNNNKLQKATEYSDNLLKAVDIISSQRISEIKFDKTVNCEIINDTNKKNGEYTVAEGNLSYKVYSEETAYSKGDAVRVQIPEGDYSKKKYILGKQSTDSEDKPISYISPLDTVLKLTDNLLEANHQDSKWELIANGDQIEVSIGVIDLTTDIRAKNSYNNNIYNTATIEAKFSTFLDNWDVREGSYGIRIEFRFLNKKGLSRTESVRLDTKNMFGNPYRFKIPAYQAKTFSLLEIDELESIQLFFYQNKDFKYQKDGVLKALPLSSLFVSDVAFGFGSNIDSIPDNSAELYSVQGIEYTDKDYQRDIGLLWYNKIEDSNIYLGFSDGIYDPEYDELKYQEEKEKLSRLNNEATNKEIPKTQKGLETSADLTELKSLVNQVIEIADKDLLAAIRGFQESIASPLRNITLSYSDPYGDEKIEIGNYIGRLVNNSQDEPGSLANYRTILENLFFSTKTEKEGLITKYRAYLKILAEAEKRENKVNPPAFVVEDFINSLTELDKLLTLGTQSLNTLTPQTFCFLGETFKNTLKDQFGGYWSVYETYNSRIWKSLENARAKIKEIEVLLNGLYEKANAINPGTEGEYSDSKLKDLEEKSKNRYCIYWYRLQKDYYNPEERIMRQGWKRLEDKTNVGLPGKGETINNVTYYAIKSAASATLPVELDPNLDEEKYLAVIYYNHEQIKTAPLTFTRVAADGEIDIDSSGVLTLSHGENSKDTYQLYGDDGYLLRQSEAHIKRKIKLSFASAYQSVNNLIGGTIFWYIPKNASMISYVKNSDGKSFNSELYKDYGFADNENGVSEGCYMDGYVVFNKVLAAGSSEDGVEKIKEEDLYFTYLIDEYYIPTHTNNTIHCRITKGNKTFTASINFVFASYGIDGTEYSLVVKPMGSQVAVAPGHPLELSIKLFDYTNKEIPLYENKPNEEVEDLYGYDFNIKFIKNQPEGVATPSVTTYKDKVTGGVNRCVLTSAYGEEEKPSYGLLEVSTKVKFVQSEDAQTQAVNDGLEYVIINKVYPVAWSSTSGQYIDGATSILYSTNGSDPKYYGNPYKLFGEDNIEQTVGWRVQNTTDISLPTIGNKKTLIPKTIYTESQDYQVVYVEKQWYQPISIELDKYDFKLLNQWDGSFKLDEANNRILSSMMVAGKKDENNTFTGVMMGDIGKADGSIIDSGLFGFQKGVNTFGFRTDGTAFIGAGTGKIDFDGTKGIIDMGNVVIRSQPIGSEAYIEVTKDNENVFKVTSQRVIFNDTWSIGNGFLVGESAKEDGEYKTLITAPGKLLIKDKVDANEKLDSYVFLAGGKKDYSKGTITELDEIYKEDWPLRISAQGGLYATKGEMGLEEYGKLFIDKKAKVSSEGGDDLEDYCYFSYDPKDEAKKVPLGMKENYFYLGKGGLSFYNPNKRSYKATKITSSGIFVLGLDDEKRIWLGPDKLQCIWPKENRKEAYISFDLNKEKTKSQISFNADEIVLQKPTTFNGNIIFGKEGNTVFENYVDFNNDVTFTSLVYFKEFTDFLKGVNFQADVTFTSTIPKIKTEFYSPPSSSKPETLSEVVSKDWIASWAAQEIFPVLNNLQEQINNKISEISVETVSFKAYGEHNEIQLFEVVTGVTGNK